MDGHNAVVLFMLEWVWVPIVAVIVWTIKRMLGLEKNCDAKTAPLVTKFAVMEASQKTVIRDLGKLDERNQEEHKAFNTKLDKHNDGVMRRFDLLTGLVKNGGK